MKKEWIIIFFVLFFSSCAKTKLIDKTLNEFQAKASKNFDDHIEVTWTKNDFYKHYQVLRSETDLGTFKSISGLINNDQFKDYDVTSGKTYYYKVRAYNNINTPLYTTEATDGFSGTMVSQPPPSNVRTVEGKSPIMIRLEWDRVNDADAYKVYRSMNPDVMTDPDMLGAGWKEVAIVRYPFYEDDDVVAGSYYYYRVGSVARRSDGSYGPVSSGFSSPIQGYTFGGDAGLSSTAGAFYDKIVLTWITLPTVKQYIVYRSEDKNVIGIPVATLAASESPTYSDYTAESEKIYYYTLLYNNDYTLRQSRTVKSYKKTDTAPPMPENFQVSQGTDSINVVLTWSKVDSAKGYTIFRSSSQNGPYEEIATINDKDVVTYRDTPPTGSYIYYYKISAFNPAPGSETTPLQGWVNRPPSNVTASTGFGNKVVLSWDPVPGATQYNIDFSESRDGSYTRAGYVAGGSGRDRVSFSHDINIGDLSSKEYYYKVQVNAGSVSDWSEPILGKIQKIGQPQNFRILNNKTSTERTLTMEWDAVPNAEQYNIYRATLKHAGASVEHLTLNDYKKVATVNDTGYQAPLNTVPLRRYVYRVVAVDGGGAEGVGSLSGIAYRLPVDIDEFLLDVDFTIIHAQTQIRGFGDNGSSGSIPGRYKGMYYYNASMSGARSRWDNYISFEVQLTGNPSISISISPMGAYMTGPVSISGLYTGTVTYNNFLGAPGGYAIGGSLTAVYNHPVHGTLQKIYSYTDAGFLRSVVLKTENKPTHSGILALFEEGGG
ncbi:fibronectin type 3 domain-containing protein [Brevinema andersonii]|uniref:Fibronectin type 3 domain-containing protein n=1 Tax=Brevinema andersonii TaxID=34097 RepID=A0A1I1DIA2_BREAD|nr:hypothetical protein [Brevinema andersonii]SFB74651.1 fibronectin type 3 domain-containing protein [Brevinema andersonii]